MRWEIAGPILGVESIAAGRGIRELARLRKKYGGSRWRKLKGVGTIRFSNGMHCQAEVHWYEAHGVGRREMKLKRLLE